MIHVTAHAIERYQERVANVPDEEARVAICSPAVLKAAEFGATYVRLGTGQRIVIEDGRVVTVLPAESFKRQVQRVGLGRYGRTGR